MPPINFTKTQQYDEYTLTFKQFQHQRQKEGQLLEETK
jgi:hypothetical protein